MSSIRGIISRAAFASFLLVVVMPAGAVGEDLSRYRDFRLGAGLAVIAERTGLTPAQTTTIHSRPALIQELKWRPRPLGPSPRTESAEEVVFTFYNGELFRIVVNYDRYETEGLTADDFIEAISAVYGKATLPTASFTAAQGPYGEQAEILAQWQDPQYRFELIRSSYAPTIRLVGVLLRLESPAEAAIREATRLDDQEAPEREAARLASEDEVEKAKLEKARSLNKPRFRP